MVKMKRIVGWVVLWCCLVGAVLPVHAAAERRVALVIGNAAYKDAPLDNPVNDARDMAEMLRRTGFEVIELINGTQKEMNRAIAKFGDRLRSDSVALFYYAGHGLQVRGKNYLVPIDAQISNETSIRVESVDVDGVLDQLASSELNVVILDACRNNIFPMSGSTRSVNRGLARVDELRLLGGNLEADDRVPRLAHLDSQRETHVAEPHDSEHGAAVLDALKQSHARATLRSFVPRTQPCYCIANMSVPAHASSPFTSARASPERKTMGVCRKASESRISAVSSMPLACGMCRSIRIASKAA